jgi:hypothetical protein
MTWRDTSNEEGAVLSQILCRDDGRLLGMIIRYDEDAPTYAWVVVGIRRDSTPDHPHYHARRLGARSTDQAARAAVERALGEVGS